MLNALVVLFFVVSDCGLGGEAESESSSASGFGPYLDIESGVESTSEFAFDSALAPAPALASTFAFASVSETKFTSGSALTSEIESKPKTSSAFRILNNSFFLEKEFDAFSCALKIALASDSKQKQSLEENSPWGDGLMSLLSAIKKTTEVFAESVSEFEFDSDSESESESESEAETAPASLFQKLNLRPHSEF